VAEGLPQRAGYGVGDDPGGDVEGTLGAYVRATERLVVDADVADAEDIRVADLEVVVDQPAKHVVVGGELLKHSVVASSGTDEPDRRRQGVDAVGDPQGLVGVAGVGVVRARPGQPAVPPVGGDGAAEDGFADRAEHALQTP
jgi:hypothetical protein